MTWQSGHSPSKLLLAVVCAMPFLAACADQQPTAPPAKPAFVVRGYEGGCVPDVIVHSSETTDTILVTFDGGNTVDHCFPNLVEWGIDVADPMGVDTPQGDQRFFVRTGTDIANMPSPPNVLGNAFTPAQAIMEFYPPIRSAAFDYCRYTPDRAIWGGYEVYADSMAVIATGDPWYWSLVYKVLHSNQPSSPYEPPCEHWDHMQLNAPGDYIYWLWFNGILKLDNLQIVRAKQDTTFHLVSLTCSPNPVTRAETVSCSATWSPPTIPAAEILFEWEFRGDSIRVFPDPTAQGFTPPGPVDSTGMGAHPWSGPAVFGGEVALTATWQGDADSLTTQFVVNPRTGPEWGALPTSLDTLPFRDIATDSTVSLMQQPSPVPGDPTLGYMGLNLDSIAMFNTALDQMIRFDDPPAVSTVHTGPNSGFGYISAPGDMRATRTVALRTWVEGHEQPKFQYSCVPGVLLTNRGLLHAMRANKSCGGNFRFRYDSAAFRNGVVGHETYGANGGRGHQGQIELAAASLPTCGRVPTIMERVVAPTSVLADETASLVLEEGRKALWAATEHHFVYADYSDVPTYEVVAGVTVVDYKYPRLAVSDTMEAAQPNPLNTPNPLYKCTRNY